MCMWANRLHVVNTLIHHIYIQYIHPTIICVWCSLSHILISQTPKMCYDSNVQRTKSIKWFLYLRVSGTEPHSLHITLNIFSSQIQVYLLKTSGIVLTCSTVLFIISFIHYREEGEREHHINTLITQNATHRSASVACYSIFDCIVIIDSGVTFVALIACTHFKCEHNIS